MIGPTIKQYHITSKIGEGGMGEVYLATDTNLKRQVALKFLPRHFSSDDEARSRFKREAQALAALNHPNIVAVHDVTEHDGQPFIAMEYVEGQSLKELIESGEVDISRAIELAAQAADGLAAAHKREIVHRDIKSENIVVSTEGRVKIMDFGLATWQGVTKVTAEGSTLGTRAYMSPEQSSGQDVDHRADLWSLGVVLYELITGRLPFEGGHDSAIAYSIANETPEPIARYKSGSPDDLQRIVSKCLAKIPAERYQSAADLATDLRSANSAPSISAAAIASPPSRSKKTLVSVGVVVAVAVIAVIAALIWNPLKEAAEQAEAKRKMLAVLPFENLGPDDQEYFADGITEEITSRLASLSGLGVTSRTSAMRYKETELSLREIGAELGVDYVLEGTIRWDQTGDTSYVRITPQLIKVSDDTHMWADRIERPLERIFAVQSDIAEHVVTALNVTLLETERSTLVREPTGNLEAYDYYLRGRELRNQFDEEGTFLPAIAMYRKAIAIDTQYALAYAALSEALSENYWDAGRGGTGDTTDTLLIEAVKFAKRARDIDPDLAEGHLAMGYYHYWGFRNYEAALLEFEKVARDQPNNSDVLYAMGLISRRQGEWTDAYERMKRGLELDPTSNSKRQNFASTCRMMRRYQEAVDVLKKGLDLFPDHFALHWDQIDAKLRLTSDFHRRQASYDSIARRHEYMETRMLLAAAGEAREFDSLLILIDFDWEFDGTPGDSSFYYAQVAYAHKCAGSDDMNRAYADSASSCLARLYRDTAMALDDITRFVFYNWIGESDSALAAAKRAYAELPISTDAFSGTYLHLYVGKAYAGTGEHEQALDILDELLTIPSDLSITQLMYDLDYDPLRENPRFQALIDRGDVVF